MPQVSVVIPLYNKGPHVERTLNSVFKQTFQDFEVIVVEGGSTDGGAEIVERFSDPRIRLVRQEGRGVSAARNQGVGLARADLIAFLDADDEWMPSHLAAIVRLRGRYPAAGIYATTYRLFLPGGKTQPVNYQYIPAPPWEGLIPDYFRSAALGDAPVWTSVVAIPKSIFHEAGGFSPGHWFQEDADLFGKVALKYPVAFSWEPGLIYHMDALNRACERVSPLYDGVPFVEIARTAIHKGEVPPERAEPLNEYVFKMELCRALRNVQAGNAKTAREILKQCGTRWNRKLKMRCFIYTSLPYPLLLSLQNLKRALVRLYHSAGHR